MKIKGVLFDLDGTLVNTSDLIIKTFEHTIKTLLQKNPTQEEITRYFGLPLRECLRHFGEDKVDEMADFYREYNLKNHDLLIKPFPKIEETMIQLQQNGIKMAVVTSKKVPMAERGLKCFNLEKYFTGIIGCDECENHKPHPEPMLRGAELINLSPEECICVGDSPFDLQSGKSAGCLTAAVKWTYFDWDKMLLLGKPDHVLAEMPDLIRVIDKENAKGRARA